MTARRSTSRIRPDAFADDEPPFETEAEESTAPVQRRSRIRSEEPDDEEERPARRSRSAAREEDVEPEGEDTVVVPISKGRSAIRNSRPASEGSNAYFRWTDDGSVQVVKFLDTDPWSYNQHWVTRSGKQSFPCIGKGCPLCEIGAKSAQKIVYTILNITHESGPTVQTLEVTQTLDDTLAKFDADKKTGPLPRLWYALSRTKKARAAGYGKYVYSILPVKDRDLEEDYGIDLDEAEDAVADAEIPTPEKVLGKIDRKVLQEIADEAMDQ